MSTTSDPAAETANAGVPETHRSGKLLPVVGAVLGGGTLIFGAVPLRTLEVFTSSATMRLVGHNVSTNGTRLVIPSKRGLFLANVTASCSSIYVLAGLTLVAFALLRVSWPRRLRALAISASFAFIFNLLRIVGSASAGMTWGRSAMVAAHDVGGTVVTIATATISVLLLWKTGAEKRTWSTPIMGSSDQLNKLLG